MSRNRKSRYAYGKCLSDECSKAKNKEIIQLPHHADFVCPECGKKLTPARPPKSFMEKWGKKLYIIFGLLAIAGFVIWLCLTPTNSTADMPIQKEPVTEPITVQDSTSTLVENIENGSDTLGKEPIEEVIDETPTIKEEKPMGVEKVSNHAVQHPAAPVSNVSNVSNGKIRLSYGSYTGDTKDGYPDGMGRLIYSISRQINRYDSKGRSAAAGDYVIGEFVRGFFVQGKHYDSNGNLIETLMIGAPANNQYESK